MSYRSPAEAAGLDEHVAVKWSRLHSKAFPGTKGLSDISLWRGKLGDEATRGLSNSFTCTWRAVSFVTGHTTSISGVSRYTTVPKFGVKYKIMSEVPFICRRILQMSWRLLTGVKQTNIRTRSGMKGSWSRLTTSINRLVNCWAALLSPANYQ